MASDPSASHRARPAATLPATPLARVLQALLGRLWYLHAPVEMRITLPPPTAMTTLKMAAKPSTERLHLRNVFAEGRRYYIQALAGTSFRLTTNAKRSWRYGHRTTAITIMTGSLTRQHEQTRMELQSRMKLTYLLDVLWLPTFISSLIVMMPWHGLVTLGLVAALYSLSWLGHRYSAALEAYEMLFFIEKTFEDYAPPLAPQIENEGAQVVYDRQRDFAAAWQSFYQEVVHTSPHEQE